MIGLTFTDNGLLVGLDKSEQVMSTHIQKWLTRVVEHLHQALARNMDGGLIGRRTGNLMRALMERVDVTGTSFVGEVWPDDSKAPYGDIQEFGGTILPKNAQSLAIPLAAMETASGVPRGAARQVMSDPRSFGFAHTFVRKGVVLGVPDGQSSVQMSNTIPLFALKPSVTIPARHYLELTLKQEWAWIADELEKITQEAVNVMFQYAG